MSFTRAVKHNAHLRMAIAGIAGSGKTFTSLTLATTLAQGKPIALIDTEHGSASKYADLFTFDVLALTNFDPRNYIKAIHEAEQEGYAVLVIDSLSHAWNGTGGALELVETVTRRNQKSNTFNAWGEVTPLQNKLIDTILASSLHIIVTMRTKTEYIVETVNGKSVPRKVGMAPIQRADVEYEFDIYADMDADNTLIIQKSRCSLLGGQVIPKPDGSLADVIAAWLEGPPAPTQERTTDGLVTPTTVQAHFAQVFKVQPTDLETRWGKFKQHVLGAPILDLSLEDEQLHLLNDYLSQQSLTQEKSSSNGIAQKAS